MVDTDWWLANASVDGLYIEDGEYSAITPDDNAYGTDIYIQEATISPDWDIYGAPGGASSGSGGVSPHVLSYHDDVTLTTPADTEVLTYDSGVWKNLPAGGGTTPIIGEIRMYRGNPLDLPFGWYVCDGANGTIDLTDGFIRGQNSTGDNILDTGGVVPSGSNTGADGNHTHGVSIPSGGAHTHGNIDGAQSGSGVSVYWPSDSGDHTHSGSTGNASPNTHTHSVEAGDLPPYTVLYYIEYTGV